MQDYQPANKKGRLKIFFGYATGVGTTYAMLDSAHGQLKRNIDVIVGYIGPHTNAETIGLLNGLPVLPPKVVGHKNRLKLEFDIDTALVRKPELIIVDELAHVNAEGMRNKKRFQDVEELLNAGINVYTTVKLQNIESLTDIVQDMPEINYKETIPDYIFDNADKVELIDIEPDELIKRYCGEKILPTVDNLRLLRELAMRKAADRISRYSQSEPILLEKKVGTNILVCISSSPTAQKSIRWTARTAEAFHAPWIALYVENVQSKYLSANEKESLQANLDLAELLGAKIVTLNGHNVASVVAEYAKRSGITNIVIGKSRNKKTLKSLFEPDIEDRLISLLPGIEIHIIPGSSNYKPYRKPGRIHIKEDLFLSWADTIRTLAVLFGATLFSKGLHALQFGNQNAIMVYILSVLFISRITMGYVYGIVASALSVLMFNFFFVSPLYTFHSIEPGYYVTFIIMLIVALITSTSTVRIRTQARLAVEREARTEVLYEINKKLLVTRGLESIVQLTNEYLVKHFGYSTIFYTQDPQGGSSGVLMQSDTDESASYLLSESERAVAHWVFINQKQAGAGTDTLMGSSAFYMPIISQGNVLGVIGISSLKGKLNRDERILLQMIASQVAMALERQYLSDEQEQMLIESEKEKMRSNLLRAISHDLRTPLTGILGASSAILEHSKSLDTQTQHKLIANIKEDSQWLIRLVENLLSITRIKEGSMNVVKTHEAAEEIVAEAISRTRKLFPDRRIVAKVPDALLMVPMDATLIEQVIINLLENAIKHSPDNSVIKVEVRKDGDFALFEVINHGEGIAEEDFPYLFESYVPNGKRTSDSARGMGIGLSICMSIIKAHKGEMIASNKGQGGAVFQFKLPLEEGTYNEQ